MVCQQGYALLKKAIDICYPIDPKLNCKDGGIDTTVYCSSCSNNNQVLVNLVDVTNSFQNYSLCMAVNPMDNCIQYDIKDD